MKYKVEVWRHHNLIVKIETNDTGNIIGFIEDWKYMEYQDYCVLEYYIDGKRLSTIEAIEFEMNL